MGVGTRSYVKYFLDKNLQNQQLCLFDCNYYFISSHFELKMLFIVNLTKKYWIGVILYYSNYYMYDTEWKFKCLEHIISFKNKKRILLKVPLYKFWNYFWNDIQIKLLNFFISAKQNWGSDDYFEVLKCSET
jgi:hypothetical protein